MIPARLLPMLLVPGVGMGGGEASAVVEGPFCICEVRSWVSGSQETRAYNAGAEEVKGDCC